MNGRCLSSIRQLENRRRSSRRRRDRSTLLSSSSSSSRPSLSVRHHWHGENANQFKRSSHRASSRRRRTSGASDAYRDGSRSLKNEDHSARRFGDVQSTADNTSEMKVRRTVLPTLKVGRYDGSTCLETFLAKFDNCCDYCNWNESEKLCHLRANLDGGAGQVLWDAGKQSSVDEIIRLLKNRFGTQNQDERYRAELKARRRRKGESLQAVYHDVRRLMAFAFSGQSGSLWEVMARDCFLEAVGEPSLRMKILEREPSALDEALKIACRLEALGKADYEESRDDLGRRKDKNPKAMALQTRPDKQTEERIKKLEAVVVKYKGELKDYKRRSSLLLAASHIVCGPRAVCGPCCVRLPEWSSN